MHASRDRRAVAEEGHRSFRTQNWGNKIFIFNAEVELKEISVPRLKRNFKTRLKIVTKQRLSDLQTSPYHTTRSLSVGLSHNLYLLSMGHILGYNGYQCTCPKIRVSCCMVSLIIYCTLCWRILYFGGVPCLELVLHREGRVHKVRRSPLALPSLAGQSAGGLVLAVGRFLCTTQQKGNSHRNNR